MGARKHRCPGGCGTAVPRHRLACQQCWQRLPETCREDIKSHAHRNPREHARAIYAAHLWFLDHPLPATEDAP